MNNIDIKIDLFDFSNIKKTIEVLEKSDPKLTREFILELLKDPFDSIVIKAVIGLCFPQYKDLLKTILVFQ